MKTDDQNAGIPAELQPVQPTIAHPPHTQRVLIALLLTPVLLGRRFTLNPVMIFVSLIFWTWLWGVPGALLSVPLLVAIKIICDRVPSLSAISELVTSDREHSISGSK